MKLRELMSKDEPYMLEWMNDVDICSNFRFKAGTKTTADVMQFIRDSKLRENNYHFAIVNESDEYLGTVSLKEIEIAASTAEYAIVLRKCAQKTGAGRYATEQILKFAFQKLGLNKVYLNVFSDNIHARGFYEHLGFTLEGESKDHLKIGGEFKNLCWYRMTKKEYELCSKQIKSNATKKTSESMVKMLEFTQRGDERGHLVVIETGKEVPIEIKRVFYIYGSDAFVVRGQHANRKSEFVLINVAGTSKIKTKDVLGREKIYSLDRPHTGIYLPCMIWKEMYDFSPDSVLLILSSEHYDPKEYITNYEDYVREIQSGMRPNDE